MAILSRQTLIVPLGGGLETELAAKLVPSGKVVELENCVVSQTGQLSKRPGSVALPSPPTPTGILATRKNALVNVYGGQSNPLQVFAGGRWIDNSNTIKTSIRSPINTSRIPVLSNADQTFGSSFNIAGPDVAYQVAFPNAVYVMVCDLDQNPIQPGTTIIIDASTGQRIYQKPKGGAGSFLSPRVLAIGSSVVVAYVDASGHVLLDVYSSAALSSGGAPTTFTITPAVAPFGSGATYLDLKSFTGTQVDIIYRSTANTVRRLVITIGTGAVNLDVEVKTVTAASINPSLALVWVQDFGNSGASSIVSAGPAGVQHQVNLSSGTPASTTVLDATATANVRNICACTVSSTPSDVNVLWDIDGGATPSNSLTRYGSHVGIGTVVSDFIRSVSLRSKLFQQGNDVYVLVTYGSATQPTYFLVLVSPTHAGTPVRAPLAQIMPTEGNGRTEKSSVLTSVVQGLNGTFVAALVKQILLESEGGPFPIKVDTEVDLVTMEFGAVSSRPVEASDTLAVPGGQLQAFDGVVFSELGFPLYPDALTSTGGAGAGGHLSAGQYSYLWVYRFTDANGRVYRSFPFGIAPTGALTFIVAANNTAPITGPTSRINGRPGGLCTIEQYRTTAGGTLYFLEATAANDPTTDTVTISSSISDASLQTGQPLYTTGGVLAAEATPGTRALTYFRDRLWFISDDDRQELWPSEVAQTNVGFHFSSDNIIRIDDENGPMYGLAGLGLNLFIFKKDQIYAINGAGPNALGQGDFGEPQRLQPGIGCSNPRSIVAASPGIFFAGEKGIWLLSGVGALSYIGSPVQAYNDEPIGSAASFPLQNQVRFYTSARVLVYDYFHQQWETFTPPGGETQVTTLQGVPVTDYNIFGNVVQEDTTGTVFTDNGDSYSMKITTPPLSFGGLQGVERVYEIQGVGENLSAHTLNVTLTYDDGSTQLYTKDFANGDDWSWRLRPERQLSSTWQVTLQDVGFDGASFTVTSLVFLVGVEPAHLKRFQVAAKSLLPA